MHACPVAGRTLAGRVTFRSALAGVAAVLALAGDASAQIFETVGARALGMGGAFVAVADDVTATYWNPAGLATGGLADGSLQRSTASSPSNQAALPAVAGGWRASTTFVGFAIPSLGISYLRTRVGQASSPTAGPTDGRQQDRPGVASATFVTIDSFGVTLLQSLAPNLVAGTTLKLARGSSQATVVPGVVALSTALDESAQPPSSARTRFDIDVGLLATVGPVRFGLVGRNLLRPDFGPDDATGPGRLDRQVRAGIALTPGFTPTRTAAAEPSLTIAFDADLTRTRLPLGDERHVAAGVERWFGGRRVGVRAGVRANTIGDRRPLGTAGASLALRPAILVEGQYGRGSRAAGNQWTAAARVRF